MALSARRFTPLRILCREWPRVRASHISARKPLVRGSGPGLPIQVGLRIAPASAFRLSQYRAYSEVKPPQVNVSLRLWSSLSAVVADRQYLPPKTSIAGDTDLHESPYTVPNALTLGRIIACPFLGYNIIQGNLEWATGILFLGGVSDWVSVPVRA